MRKLVNRHGDNHQHTGNQHLIDRGNPHQLKTITEDADDQHADQGAQNVTAATKEARPTQHHCGDTFQVRVLPRLRVTDTGAGRQQ